MNKTSPLSSSSMASASGMSPPRGTINFPNMLGTSKRRRMRSGGNVSAKTNNNPEGSEDNADTEPEASAKCKGATTIPIFLKKTYKMIDSCDPEIASWTPDGEMFVVKDPDLFAAQVIPQYFDHNKFSSFARQLNFYGFRKMQAKPIRNADYDSSTSKHVTFFNEKFKRGRCDLLKDIQRSTRGGGSNNTLQDHQKEVELLKAQVAELEQALKDTKKQMEERVSKLELDMLGQMEQMMLVMQRGISVGGSTSLLGGVSGETWEPMATSRRSSAASNFSLNVPMVSSDSIASKMAATPPTLPPHPKQQNQLPVQGLPTNLAHPLSRLNSLRGLSRGMSRGMSVESSASAVVMRNSWEDKFFSMLMLGESEAGAAAAANAHTEQAFAATNVEAAQNASMSEIQVQTDLAGASGLAVESLRQSEGLGKSDFSPQLSERSLSSVSTSDMP